MNLGNCTPSICDVNTYDRFVTCSGNGQLYSASSPSKIVINNSCGWLNGLGNQAVSTYYPIHVNGVGNNYNYLIDGSLYYLTNSTYNGLPLNGGGNFIGYGGPSKSGIFFNVEQPELNYFYVLKTRAYAFSDALSLGIKFSMNFLDGGQPTWTPGNVDNDLNSSTIGEYTLYPGLQFNVLSQKIEVPDFYKLEDLGNNVPHFQIGIHARGYGPGNIYAIDRIDFDCDPDEIVFRPEIKICDLSELTDCLSKKFCLTLRTECPEVNFSAFNYSIKIFNLNNQLVHTINNLTGQNNQFAIDNLPVGSYYGKIDYDNTNGKNIKVDQFFMNQLIFNIENDPFGDFQINDNVTYSTPIYVPTNIVVNSGATLRIANNAYIKDNRKITINPGGRLEVYGNGHLTKCTNHWQGVRINGNGTVVISGEGTISYANIGIEAAGDGNSIIECTDANFVENVTAVAAYHRARPSFVQCDFIGGSQGVYLDNVTGGTTPNGVLFSGNSFSYQSEQGIMSWNTGINVGNGNQFTGCGEGVGIRNLFGNSQQAIVTGGSVSNLFTNCERGIYSNAGWQEIKNNVFQNNGFGSYLSGLNDFSSSLNSFGNGHGEAIYSTGSGSNISERNDYNSNEGIFTWQNNDNYVFKANCFSTLWYDVNAWGTINGAQGDAGIAASNCFTGGGVPDFACNTSNSVGYYLPKPTVTYSTCLIPTYAGNYTNWFVSDDEFSNQCGTTLGTQPAGEYDAIKAMGCDSTQLADFIQYVSFQKIRPLLIKQKNGTITRIERSELARWQRHLRYAVNQWAWCLRKDDKYAQLYVWYKAQQDKDFDIKAVETKVMMAQYEQAIAELDSVRAHYEMDTLIYQSILLNIREIRKDIASPTYTSAERQVLRTTAALSDPYAAYARALLYKLTGEQIEPYVSLPVMPRGKLIIEKGERETYNVMPNPVTDVLNLNIENYHSDEVYTYKIASLSGVTVKSGVLLSNNVITVNDFPTGLYIIRIYKGSDAVKIEKLVCTK